MSCLTYAIHYLSKYPKTVFEMRQQLKKKWFADEEIDETMPKLETAWYLHDRNYAQAYLQSEVVRKGKPLLLIKQKLLMKGVEKDMLEELISSWEEDLSEGQQTKLDKEIIRLRDKGKSDPEITQTLVRKWFSYELVKKRLSISLDQEI